MYNFLFQTVITLPICILFLKKIETFSVVHKLGAIKTFCQMGYIWDWGYHNVLSSKFIKIFELIKSSCAELL